MAPYTLSGLHAARVFETPDFSFLIANTFMSNKRGKIYRRPNGGDNNDVTFLSLKLLDTPDFGLGQLKAGDDLAQF